MLLRTIKSGTNQAMTQSSKQLIPHFIKLFHNISLKKRTHSNQQFVNDFFFNYYGACFSSDKKNVL